MYSMTITKGEEVIFTSEEVLLPYWIIDRFVPCLDLGRVTAQTKCTTKGTICYEGGVITYEAIV